jgi:hypothetical protein
MLIYLAGPPLDPGSGANVIGFLWIIFGLRPGMRRARTLLLED